ncbi:MAG TPA: peptide-methionine (S)-S-oxide reductase MsrA [Candidatus Dormibacteraeota bacterium]|nr:peptide-methionine (S)-S-oxide reductase MsrA [Candidatus Dormibacteraeota bacterium]
MEQAILAAGCFWGVQFYFDQIPGVIKTTVGYTGGKTKDPNYEQVCSQTTGHAEAVKLEFDSQKVSYKTLLKHFFRMHDPTQLNRQGQDIGHNYRSAIFYLSPAQKKMAKEVLNSQQKSLDRQIVTQIVPASQFYEAEAYHQKFSERRGRGMCHVAYQPIS